MDKEGEVYCALNGRFCGKEQGMEKRRIVSSRNVLVLLVVR